MREVVADFQLCGDPRVFGEFLPVVGSHRVQQVPVRHERRDRRVGQLGRVLCPQRLQDAELGHPVVRREQVAPVARPVDQVYLEVTEAFLRIHDRGSLVDPSLAPDGAAPVPFRSTLAVRPSPVSQVRTELRPAADSAVYRRDARRFLSLQPPAPDGLFRRQVLPDGGLDLFPDVLAIPVVDVRLAPERSRPPVRRPRIIPVPASVVAQLPRQGSRRDSDLSCDILLEKLGFQRGLDLVS